MADLKKNFYQELGVPNNASESDIKAAFRRGAKENHPDANGNLTPQEQAVKEAKFKNINNAYEILSDENKRKFYDMELKKGDLNEVTAEGATRTTNKNTTKNEGGFGKDSDPFDDFYKNYEAFIKNWDSPFGAGKPKKPQVKDESFMIPENDWGLFAALKMAYASKEDGKWRVKKSETDTRDWMPENVYSIIKTGDNVQVLRKMTDWRGEWSRKDDIKIRKEGSYTEKEKLKPTSFINEYYLAGEGKRNLEESYNIPAKFGEYLNSLKSLAKKFADKSKNAEGNYDVQPELTIINTYGEHGSKNTRTEGGIWKNEKDYEWVKEIRFENFFDKLKQSEGRVTRVEGPQATPEGQAKSTFQGGSGEAKG